MYYRDIETSKNKSEEYNRNQKANAAERMKKVKAKMAFGKKNKED